MASNILTGTITIGDTLSAYAFGELGSRVYVELTGRDLSVLVVGRNHGSDIDRISAGHFADRTAAMRQFDALRAELFAQARATCSHSYTRQASGDWTCSCGRIYGS